MKMEEQGPSGLHPQTLKEQPPVFLVSLYENVTGFVASNGWYIVFFAIMFAAVWPRLRSFIENWQEDNERRREAAFHSKYPDERRNRQLAVEIARQRMQLEHDKLAERAAEAAKEREELRRQERLARLDKEGGHRLNAPSSSSGRSTRQEESSSTFRPDYNPLMGSGSSSSYHPTRRTCPGGGCG